MAPSFHLGSTVLLFWATTATAAMLTLYFTPGATSCTKGYSACVGVKPGNNGVPSNCCYAVIGQLRGGIRVNRDYFGTVFHGKLACKGCIIEARLKQDILGIKECLLQGHPCRTASHRRSLGLSEALKYDNRDSTRRPSGKMGGNSNSKASTISVLSSRTLTHCW